MDLTPCMIIDDMILCSFIFWSKHMSFLAYELSSSSRNELLKSFPPKYPVVICNHITIRYPATKDTEIPEKPKSCQVIGYLDDGRGLKCLVVAINGSISRPYDNKIYHITHSLNSLLGYKPADSNNLLAEHRYHGVNPIDIDVEPKLL